MSIRGWNTWSRRTRKRTTIPHATIVTATGRFFFQTFLRRCILRISPDCIEEQVKWNRVSIA